MSSIKELYEDALKYDHHSLAHYILHLLQEGKVSFEDDESALDFSQADHQKARLLIAENYLHFDMIKVFALKHSDHLFAFVYARSQQEAISFFLNTCKQKPKNCYEYPLDYEIEKGNRIISFRDLKKEFPKCPAFIGNYERESVYQ